MFAYCNNGPIIGADPSGQFPTRPIAVTDGGGGYAISKKDRDTIDTIESQGHHILNYNSTITSVSINHTTFEHSVNDCDVEATTTEKLLRWGAEGTAPYLVYSAVSKHPITSIGILVGAGICWLSDLVFPPERCPFDHECDVVYDEDVITVCGYWTDVLTGTRTYYKDIFVVTYKEVNQTHNTFPVIAVIRDYSHSEYNQWG